MDKIHEIRVEEVHDRENGTHFYRVYYEVNEQIKIMVDFITKLKSRVDLSLLEPKIFWKN